MAAAMSSATLLNGSVRPARLNRIQARGQARQAVGRRSFVLRAQQGGRFDEGSTEVRRLVKRDQSNSSRDEVQAMSVNAAESTPKSLDELEKLFEASDIESLKVETPKPSETASKTSPFAGAGDNGAKPATPFGSTSAKAAASPFGAASAKSGSTASPFGASSGSASSPFAGSSSVGSGSPFGSTSGIQEPKGLSPNMTADPVEAEAEGPFAFLGGLKTAQIVTVISFTLIICLMLATFNIVLNSGAIHFND